MPTHLDRRRFLQAAALGAAGLASARRGRAADRAQPNIVVILADDYGYGSCGCYGADPALVRTPNIDRLAAEGRRFTDANTPSSVCSPTRYGLMTGRYCWRTSLGHQVLGTFAPLHIEPTRLTLASLLKRCGYHTAAVGKWHLGYGDAHGSLNWRTDYAAELSPGPLDVGFDYHFGVPSNHGDLTGVFVEDRYVYGLRGRTLPDGMKLPAPDADDPNFQATYTGADMENAKGRPIDLDAPRRRNQRVMAELTDKAVAWLDRQPKAEPFFLYYTPVAVHNPVTPDADLAGQSKAGLYADWISELDRGVGRILAKLDQMGVRDNTLVLFTSDNGGVFRPENEAMLQTIAYRAGLKVNGPLRGGKHTVWDGGFTVPFIVRWPGHVAAGSTCDEMVSLVDMVATTAALVGEPLPQAATAAEDSHNILTAILGQAHDKPLRPDMVVHSADGVFAIRRGPWKWIEGVPVDDLTPGERRARADEFRAQLYNVADDPAETKDVSAQHPDVVADLKALLARYRDGGYSRELPPIVPPKPVAALPPLAGRVTIDEKLDALPTRPWATPRGDWQVKDGALWGASARGDAQPADLTRPLNLNDGTIQFEVNFGTANRLSLRLRLGEQSVRIVIAPSQVEVAKNPGPGEAADRATTLARAKLRLRRGEWATVRASFAGPQVTVQVGGVTAKGTHPVLAGLKQQMDLLVFEGDCGLRQVVVARQ
ncbi:MAG: arylsulfatase [Armatimonadetes bacterium]|nr:arylsulfatase [Armatimonadota bacterium]